MGGSSFNSSNISYLSLVAWEGLYNCDDNFLFMGGGGGGGCPTADNSRSWSSWLGNRWSQLHCAILVSLLLRWVVECSVVIDNIF